MTKNTDTWRGRYLYLSDVPEAQRMLLVMLIRDFGYSVRKPPHYGEAPLRHQFAWDYATRGISKRRLRRFCSHALHQHRREIRWITKHKPESLQRAADRCLQALAMSGPLSPCDSRN